MLQTYSSFQTKHKKRYFQTLISLLRTPCFPYQSLLPLRFWEWFTFLLETDPSIGSVHITFWSKICLHYLSLKALILICPPTVNIFPILVVVRSPRRVWLFATHGHSTPGLPIPHHLLEFAQVHVHRFSDAIQPSHPLTPSSPSALNLFQHQRLSMSHLFASDDQNSGASASESVLPVNIQGWFPLWVAGLISLMSKWLSGVFSAPQFKGINSSGFYYLHLNILLFLLCIDPFTNVIFHHLSTFHQPIPSLFY